MTSASLATPTGPRVLATEKRYDKEDNMYIGIGTLILVILILILVF